MEECMQQILEEEILKAYERGKEEGVRQGYAEARREAHGFFQLVQKMTEKIIDEKVRTIHRLKPELIEFSLNVCERICRQELSNPQALVKLLDTLLASSVPEFKQEQIKVFIGEEDHEVLSEYLGARVERAAEIANVRFLADATMKRGDVRIETKTTLVTATIQRELDDLRAKVMSV